MLHNHEGRSTSLRRHLTLAALWAILLSLVTLVACISVPTSAPSSVVVVALGTPVELVDQVTLAAVLTEQQNNADFQAAESAGQLTFPCLVIVAILGLLAGQGRRSFSSRASRAPS